MNPTINLGHNHILRFFRWAPDRKLNPQYQGIPDLDMAGAIIDHLTPDFEPCSGAVQFDHPVARQRDERSPSPPGPYWTIESIDPLTISPSIKCSCGDHGFVKDGKWVPA